MLETTERTTLTQRPLMTVDQIATRLNVTPHTVNRWLRDGDLAGYKVGKEWRVEPDDFERFLRERYRPEKEKEG